MATKYSEPVSPGSLSPEPYRSKCDEDFDFVFQRMRGFLNVGYAINDLLGLERVGHLLYQVELYQTFEKKDESKMSLVFTEKKLAELVEILKNFQPMLLETSDVHLQFAHRFNFKECYDDFLTYIDDISSSLVSTAQESGKGMNSVLHLQRIKFDVAKLRTCIEKKFTGYHFTECHIEFIHWVTRTSYTKENFPYAVVTILRQFPESSVQLPPCLFPENSIIFNKLCFDSKVDLQGKSIGRECALCPIPVMFLAKMSVLPDCDHVFCSNCLKDWLHVNGNDQWMCPTCRTPIEGYGSIDGGNHDTSVTFFIPPHSVIISLDFYRILKK